MKKRYYKSLIAGAVLASFIQVAVAETISLSVTQDTWTDGSNAGTGNNKDATNILRIDTGKNRAFVQFTVQIPTGHIVDTATLTLTANAIKAGTYSIANTIPDTFIAPIVGVDWDETTLTDLTDDALLAAVGTTLDSATDIAVGTSVDFDVKSAITGDGDFTFLVDMVDSTARAVKYDSSLATDEATRPKLTITTVASGPVDSTAPVFDANIAAIEINATGPLTDISAGVAAANITALDETDADPIAATITSVTNLASGVQTVTLQATDAAGNPATTNVTVNITPLLTLSGDDEVGVGTTASVAVGLSGPAVTYPVTLDYNIAGVAVTDSSGTLTFNDDTAQNVDVTLLGDALGGTTGVLTLSGAVNAQLPLVDSTTITAIAGNAAPSVTLTLAQNGVDLGTITADNADVIHYVDATAGLVTVSAAINDLNADDTHDISWAGSSADLSAQGLSFDFSPELLAGDFTLTVIATENNTGDDLFSSTPLTTPIKIITSALPPLTDVDSDGDGTPDSEEGYKDSDGDGIVDYLDNNPDTTQLPLADGQAPLQTEAGLSLSLGSVSTDVLGVDADSAIISLADLSNTVPDGSEPTTDSGYFALDGASLLNFTLSGVTDGDAAAVVYPLPEGVAITASTEYRKYTPSAGWVEFVNQGDNAIASTAKVDVNGTLECPAPNDVSYLDGLTAGDNCIQLTIVDGGIYDADGLANGTIEDPGVLAEANAAPEWNTDSISFLGNNINENSNVTIKTDLTTRATDADGDTLTFAKVSGPDWLTVVDAELAAVVSDLPTGDYSGVVSVTDIKAQTTEITVNFSIVLNKAPVFTPVELANASRNEAYSASIAAQASDVEGDSLTFSKVSGPHWLKVSETGELSGTPLKADIGDSTISIAVTDDKGAKANATVVVTVTDSNVRASKGGSFSATLFAMLGLVSLRRRKQK